MSATDDYQTLSGSSEGEFKDRGSKFYGYAAPARSEDECRAVLDQVRQQHPKARHFCYAYRLGYDGTHFRSNDDGEPSGTAGRPILGQIDRLGLTDCIVIVVRYFGGTLLGSSGLIQAYREAARQALERGQVITRTRTRLYRVGFDYGLMGSAMDVLKKLEIEIVSQRFEEQAEVTIALPRSAAPAHLDRFKADLLGITLNELPQREPIEGLRISEVPDII